MFLSLLIGFLVGNLLCFFGDKICMKYFDEKLKNKRKFCIIFLTTVVFNVFWLRYDFSQKSFYYLILSSMLIIISFIDIDYFIVPDEVIFWGSVFASFFNFKNVLGGLCCFLIIYVVTYFLSKITKKEVLGGGDIKLYFMIAVYLGFESGILTVISSVHIGAVFGLVLLIFGKFKNHQTKEYIAFAPFISLACFFVMFFGDDVVRNILFNNLI